MSKDEKIIINIYNNFVKLNDDDKKALINTLIQMMILEYNLDFKDFINTLQLSNKLLGLPNEL